MSVGLAAILIPLLSAIVGITGAAVTFLIRRRNTSGQVDTSDAQTLWAQSQSMRESILAQLVKAEQQRDNLMELYSANMSPVLAQINASLLEITKGLGSILTMVRSVDRRVTDIEQREVGIGEVSSTVNDLLIRLKRMGDEANGEK